MHSGCGTYNQATHELLKQLTVSKQKFDYTLLNVLKTFVQLMTLILFGFPQYDKYREHRKFLGQASS